MEQKKINRNIIFSVVGVLLLIAVVAGATYAYFSATASTDVQTVTTGSLTMGFASGDIVRADALVPIADSEIKTKAAELDFSVTNTGTEHMKLTISLTDIVIPDALKDVDFRWGLYNKDTGNGLSFGIFKDIGTATSMVIYRDTIIDAVLDENEPDITNNYTLRVWIHDDGALQNYMQGQTFSARVTVDGEAVQYTDEDCFGFDSGTITSYDYETCGSDIIIPKTINGVTVTNILDLNKSNFDPTEDEYMNLNSLIIPNTVTTIGRGLYFSEIEHITIPENVTSITESEAFTESGIKTVYLPETITSIDSAAFAYNPLEIIIYPGSINDFGGWLELGSNTRPTTVILMDGITTLPDDAFFSSNLSEIEIPTSVTTIGKWAFESNDKLSEIVVRGKTSAPATFNEDWNCKDEECTERYDVVYRP